MSSNLAQYILPLAILAVAIALLFGLWNMLRAGSASRSQNLMRWRVVLQFLAVLAVMAALFFSAR
ncbi:MAG TPA: twin transmembrane helix small protein [Hyphomicrobiales bacterium]|nr:twin transmembrane helix small protein [Rhodobiaceae bacterium]HXK53287.1 twin transmembrane helix small protein [Hyphomicrobiales bacterium]